MYIMFVRYICIYIYVYIYIDRYLVFYCGIYVGSQDLSPGRVATADFAMQTDSATWKYMGKSSCEVVVTLWLCPNSY